jgi:hypothetical protein
MALLGTACGASSTKADGTAMSQPSRASAASSVDLPPCSQLTPDAGRPSPVTREQAVAIAETFVRAAGYTDAPATCIAFESVHGFRDDPARALTFRRGTLVPNAWGVRPMKIDMEGFRGDWGVMFLFFPPERSFHPSPPTVRGLDCPQDASTTINCVPVDRRSEPSGRIVLVDRETGRAVMAHEDGRLCRFEPFGRDAGADVGRMRAAACGAPGR